MDIEKSRQSRRQLRRKRKAARKKQLVFFCMLPLCLLILIGGKSGFADSPPMPENENSPTVTQGAINGKTPSQGGSNTGYPTQPQDGMADTPQSQLSKNAANTQQPQPPSAQSQPPATQPSDSWNLLLVNPWNSIPENFSVELTKLKNGHSVDKRIYPDLQQMMDDARAAGLSPLICSSYRTMDKQTSLFNNQVAKYKKQGYSEEDAKKQAGMWVAVPGTSEHQVGLAVDIVAVSNQRLDKSQEQTAEQQWLMKNCHKYGFILRYPTNKSDITGIGYEPWHYRYVGKDVAEEIMSQGICLEEYLDEN